MNRPGLTRPAVCLVRSAVLNVPDRHRGGYNSIMWRGKARPATANAVLPAATKWRCSTLLISAAPGRGHRTARSDHPQRAASIAPRSIVLIGIIASNARLATAGSASMIALIRAVHYPSRQTPPSLPPRTLPRPRCRRSHPISDQLLPGHQRGSDTKNGASCSKARPPSPRHENPGTTNATVNAAPSFCRAESLPTRSASR